MKVLGTLPQKSSIQAASNEKPSFYNVKEKLKNLFLDGNSPLHQVEKQLLTNKNFSPKELLAFQIQASRYHVKVEMASKVAEAALATSRRLQQVQ